MKKINLENILEDALFMGHPMDRIAKGISLPIFTMHSPLFDQASIFPEDAWEGVCAMAQDYSNLQHFSQNTIPLFIHGGLIGEWRFMFSKIEAPRLKQRRYDDDSSLSQENLAGLKESFGRAREKIRLLPDNVAIFYAEGEQDKLNKIEIFSYYVDLFAHKVMDIYNSVKNTSQITNSAADAIRSYGRTYESRISAIRDRNSMNLSMYNVAYEKKVASISEKISLLKEDISKCESDKGQLEKKLENLAQEDLELNVRLRISKKKKSAEIEKLMLDNENKRKKLAKDYSTVSEKIATALANLGRYESKLSEEKDNLESKIEADKISMEEKMNDSIGILSRSIALEIKSLIGRYNEKSTAIMGAANFLLNTFNTPTMAVMHKQFSDFARFYETCAKKLEKIRDISESDPTWFIDEYSEFHNTLTQIVENFEKRYNLLKIDFSISEMFSRVTKRKIPKRLIAEIADLADMHYTELLESAIGDDGKRNVSIVKNGFRDFRFINSYHENVYVRFGGYGGLPKDSIKSARTSLINRLANITRGMFRIYDNGFFENPFDSFEFNDKKKISNDAYNKAKIDILLVPGNSFAVSPARLTNSPHTTYLCEIGPFYDTDSSKINDLPGSKTKEKKRAVQGAVSGFMLLDIAKSIMQATPYTLDHIAGYDGKYYPVVNGVHTGDQHVFGGSDHKSMMGFYELLSRDSNLDFIIDTGDNINGKPRDNRSLQRHPYTAIWDIGEQFAYYWAIASKAYKSVLKRSGLTTKIWLSKGQHDQGLDPISLQQLISDIKMIDSTDNASPWLIWKKMHELGYGTPFDRQEIMPIIQHGEGYGIAEISIYGEDPFAYILATHNDGLDTKTGSKYTFPEALRGWNNRQGGGIRPEIAVTMVGDRHANQFQMTNLGYFDMCGTFEDPQRQDGFQLRFGYNDAPVSFTRLSIPKNGTNAYPVTATFIPQYLMDAAFDQYISPIIEAEMNKQSPKTHVKLSV